MNYVNDWWAGFAELILICMMYELWMMFRYKITSVWMGGNGDWKVWVRFSAGKIWI